MMTRYRIGALSRVVIRSVTMSLAMAMLAASVLAQDDGDGWPVDGWQEREYRYVIIDQDVRDVLREMGHNLSIPVEISQEVGGSVRGDIRAETAEEFLDQISAANGLAWFFDGSGLHVTTRREMMQRNFDLSGVDPEQLMEEIEGSRVGSPLRARLVAGDTTLQAWGPPAWIDGVEQRVERLRQPAPRGPSRVRVFRGGSAPQAAD